MSESDPNDTMQRALMNETMKNERSKDLDERGCQLCNLDFSALNIVTRVEKIGILKSTTEYKQLNE